MRCIHNTDKPYYCEICEEYFKIKTEYEDHVEKNHLNEISQDLDGIFYTNNDVRKYIITKLSFFTFQVHHQSLIVALLNKLSQKMITLKVPKWK